jgi:hypothetical protein
MAKARDIAALAGLAGLAYAMRNKGDSSKTDTGDETERLKARKPVEEEPRRTMAGYMAKAPADTKSNVQADVLSAITAPKAASNDKAPSQGVLPPKSLTPAVEPKVKSSTSAKNPNYGNEGRSSSTVAKNPNYGNEGRSSSTVAKNPNYSNEGRSSVKPTPPAATPAKSSGRVPTSEEAAANRQALYDKVTSGVGGYLNDTFTLEGRERAKKAASGMKRGGMVSKGSSASSRADGIATKGKTRGKIC